MSVFDTIKTWKWRIVRADHTMQSFCELVKVNPSLMSQYISGQIKPSIERYDLIEGKLREFEKAQHDS
jgi:transcriptional regulator with XRE-family HTH domain